MWERNILLGQWLFVACCIAYLIWWSLAFRPGYSAPVIAKIIPFAVTALCGVAGLSFVIMGCQGAKEATSHAAGHAAGGVGNIFIIGACAAAYMILLVVTNVAMHRQVTTELMLIVFWICMQLCIINTMHGGGHWGLIAAIILAVLALIAAAAGMICYLMYYNLEPMKGFYMGMVPLILFAAYGAGIAIYQMAT